MTTLNALKVGESVVIGQWVVVRKSADVYRLGEVAGDWLMHGDSFAVSKRLGELRNRNAASSRYAENGSVTEVADYQLCLNGRYVRMATKVRFSDGQEVKFMDRLSHRLAVTQALEFRNRETKVSA